MIRQEYPHLYDFLSQLESQARQKRIDRELEKEFGRIEEQEEEEIYQLENLK